MTPWVLLFWLVLATNGSKIDEGPELAADQILEEAVLEAKFFDYRERLGINDRRTLEVFFQLFDLWIMLYRLNKADEALKEVFPACEWRQDDLTIQAIQALAFTRWKQGRFKEALTWFHQMEGLLGKSAALCENIGHTYNSLGMPAEAEMYFVQSLMFLSTNSTMEKSNKGGVLLGLAGVREKQSKLLEARESAQEAYDLYKKRDSKNGWESSLTAKAAMTLSKLALKLGDLEEAEKRTEEAVRLFESTSGEDSPLLAGAFKRLGEIRMAQERWPEARSAFHSAYKLEAIKDAFDLTEVVIIHQHLSDSHLGKGELDRKSFRPYFPTIAQVLKRVYDMKQDGNAGAYYKLAGEFFVLGEDCEAGKSLLSAAVALLETESSIDTSGMVQSCKDLIGYCGGTSK
ncbi:HET-E1 [Symbiodinium natans]|uniref:HET-E1 protein n=1 Tax=Symbiodinium natans TaxID=878477 RepID=A0A812LUI3_9DINO|nr:HET-E1 [Symbiodinium natans]